MEKKTDNLVTKNNQLVTAHYRLSVKAQLLIITLISKINPKGDLFQRHKFKLDEIYKILRVHNQSKKRKMAALDKALEELMTSQVRIVDLASGKKRFKPSVWLESPVIAPDENFMTLRPAENLMPLLVQLHENFTRYKHRDIISLTNQFSFRFLEFCKNEEPRADYYDRMIDGRYVNERIFTVKELRQRLQIPEKVYTKFDDFKKRIVLAAQKEINAKTSAYFEFQVFRDLKEGRRAIGFKLQIYGGYVSTRPENSENPNLTPPSPEEAALRLRMAKMRIFSRFQNLVFSGEFDLGDVETALDAVEEWQKRLKKKGTEIKYPARALELALLENWLSDRETNRRNDEQKTIDRLADQEAEKRIKEGLEEHERRKIESEERKRSESYQKSIEKNQKLLDDEAAAFSQAENKLDFVVGASRRQFSDLWTHIDDSRQKLFTAVLAEKIEKGAKYADLRSCLDAEVFGALFNKNK